MGAGEALVGGFRAGFDAATYGDRMRMEQEEQALRREDALLNKAMVASNMAQALRSRKTDGMLQLMEITATKNLMLAQLPTIQESARKDAYMLAAAGDAPADWLVKQANASALAQQQVLSQLGGYQEQENILRRSFDDLSRAEAALIPIMGRAAGVQGSPGEKGSSDERPQGPQMASGGAQAQPAQMGQPQQPKAPGDAQAASPLPSGAAPIMRPGGNEPGTGKAGQPPGQAPAAGEAQAASPRAAANAAVIEDLRTKVPQLFAGDPQIDAEGGRIIYSTAGQKQQALEVLNAAGMDPAKMKVQLADQATVKMEGAAKTRAMAPAVTRAATSRAMPIQLIADEGGNSMFTSGVDSEGRPLPVSFEQQTSEMEEGEDGIERPKNVASKPSDVSSYLRFVSDQITPNSPMTEAVNRDLGPALATYLSGLEAAGRVERKFGDTFTYKFTGADDTRELKLLSDNLERLREKMGDAVAIPSLIPPDPIDAVRSFVESKSSDMGTMAVVKGIFTGRGTKDETRRVDKNVKSLVEYLKQFVDPKTGTLDMNLSSIIGRELKDMDPGMQGPIRDLLHPRYRAIPTKLPAK